ncbi:DinB superfamily protein [Reichenbachiella faecimaris]|uniref:DinB superfamily protein n=1 Tax=Reichenbachiella faecimaris TaxID=692418 RepID=A0A1W2G616_REIFA|nr:DinB family protein [Reichenbachiella faecimaris]SMD32110.1 DinB superfamily protein [Reichenbachiella faecimaris]
MALRNEILMAFDSLEDKRRNLEERLDLMDAELFVIPEANKKWSINQVLSHLSNSEFGTVRYIKKKMLGLDTVGKRDFASKVRSKLLKWLLDSPVRFKMPKQLPEPSNEYSFEKLKSQFEKNRSEIKDLIETFPEESLDKLIFKHPFAGRFSLLQAITFLEDHYNHHVKQIDRILKAIENRGKLG